MSIPALWPLSLPLYADVKSVSGAPQDQVHKFQPQQGLPIVRPHQTAVLMQYKVGFSGLSERQIGDFWQFRDESLALGALAFAWLHPRKRQLREMRFLSLPRETQLGAGRWGLTFDIEFIDVAPAWVDSVTFAAGHLAAI